MKKVKIMLLSLALFAIVGGALAFKAKFSNDWCTAPAYFDALKAQPYYCSFDQGGGHGITTTGCVAEVLTAAVYNDPNRVLKVCTTIPDQQLGCATNCTSLTSITTD